MNDIWLVSPERQIDVLAERFDAAFQKRIRQGTTNPLLKALNETFKWEFGMAGLCVLFASLCQVLTPYVLKYLIQSVTESYTVGKTGGNTGFSRQIGLVFTIMIMQLIQSSGTNQFIYRGFMVGVQARAVLITVIFEKTLRISGRARAGAETDEKEVPTKKKKKNAKGDADEAGWSNGRVMNLMSTDTSRVEQAAGMFHLVWVSPITIFIALALLIVNITYSALAGFALLFFGIPVLTLTMKALIKRRKGVNSVTDSRISLTQEILRSVRFVKYYGWENAFMETLRNLRKHEVALIQKLLALRNAMNAVSVSLPIFASMLSFIVYSLTGHELTPAIVFSSLSIFNSLRVPFNLLPVVIGQLTDALASTRRIQDYLLTEDHQDQSIWDDRCPSAIDIRNASFIWEQAASKSQGEKGEVNEKTKKEKRDHKSAKSSDIEMENSPAASSPSLAPFGIDNLSLSIGRNELVAVIGSVGSGKSSLLSALAGEMRQDGGQMTIGASRAFCPQYSWIQNTTVQNNILFGKEMDKAWYETVVQACALKQDLAMLPGGDQTEIGERGITLSGGQRQRLNIARAIYFDSDIVIMDDPLSAVDAHVGRHIFENAICGVLRNKCRVLATHRHDILPRCDRIILLDNGQIRANGTYENLMKNNRDFQALIASSSGAASEEQEQEPVAVPTEQKAAEPAANAEPAKSPEALIQQEERSTTSVGWSVYSAYIRATGSIYYGLIPIVLLVVAQGANLLTSLWLSYWTDDRFKLTKGQYIGIYVGLGILQALLMFAFSVSVSMLATTASRTMTSRALDRVLKAPMSFFDTTPLGRITNRFSKDVDTMDNTLSDAIRMFLYTVVMVLSVFILVIFYFHYFGIALGPLLFFFFYAAAYYRASARDLKRHEAVLRSVVFARFSEAISGTSCIRAYGQEKHFTSIVRQAIDNMNSSYYLTFGSQRWLTTRLDVVSILLVATTGVLIVTLRNVVSPSISGLVFSYVLAIVQMTQLLIRQFAELETSMNSTERLDFYGTCLDQEEKEDPSSPPVQVDSSWPQNGAIDFDNAQMRYREGLPLVLKGLDLKVAGGESIGIVGRTGAGKSSIMTALFRLTDLAAGKIKIDGVDISKVPCHDLRSRLSIIPQDPTLFQGTIRSNLDPFNKHPDLTLWSALRETGLVKDDNTNSASRVQLDTTVEEEGLNFSLGQRQLVALARALVRGSKIVVFDEATSSIDLETDDRIQETIRRNFKGRTVLCIAHRLRTIIRYDRVCVMDKGRIAELDTPFKLWRNGGIFRGMCDQSGIVQDDFF
jgi:ABC-type multidrug transport system fused ATPase/permease subunit